MKLIGYLLLSSILAETTGGTSALEALAPLNRDPPRDRRVLINRSNDYSFLNAVGAVWPGTVVKSATGFDASTGVRAATGFLIDRCHVLTSLHVVYTDATVVNPPLGSAAAFAVGRTPDERDRGALQGLKALFQGRVVAHGNTMIFDDWVRTPADDWALLRLTGSVDPSITPMTLQALPVPDLPPATMLSSAGFPSDHRALRGDGLKLKDLWGADGRLVAAVPVGGGGEVLLTTIQTTAGDSGAPVFGDFNGHRHAVIGIIQSIRGNGLDATAAAPNVAVGFTTQMLTRVAAARLQSPCL